jgi:hypothetical protein
MTTGHKSGFGLRNFEIFWKLLLGHFLFKKADWFRPEKILSLSRSVEKVASTPLNLTGGQFYIYYYL